MQEARSIIESLGLAAHPEGGWYRETWRAAGKGGERSPGTAILYLLEAGERSHWHRVSMRTSCGCGMRARRSIC